MNYLIIVFIGVAVMAFGIWLILWLSKEKIYPSLISATYHKEILTLNYSDGSCELYKGESTVWYSYPMMRRCSALMECKLLNIHRYIQEHGNPYPTAHKLK